MPAALHTPPRLISIKVEPRTRPDAEALRGALGDMMREDPDFSVSVDPESGETILHGMGELHLDEAVGRLLARGIGVNAGAPFVAYLETPSGSAEVDHTHRRQGGGTRQFARVKLRLEPSGDGNAFAVASSGSALPDAYVAGIEKGVRSIWDNGVLIGFPMTGMKVTLLDSATGEDSSALAFEVAARIAEREGCEKAGMKLLEPIMNMEVATPSDCIGQVIGDLNAGRAFVETTETRDDWSTVIQAKVPLASLFGYVARLRSLSDGRAKYRMAYSHYQEVPRNIAPDPDTFPPAVGMRA